MRRLGLSGHEQRKKRDHDDCGYHCLVLSGPIKSPNGWKMFPSLHETQKSGAFLHEAAVFRDVVSGANAEKDADSAPVQAPRIKIRL
jgi:hypothetical protein